MLWALGGARFLGQLGTYLVPRLHHSASHCSDLFRLALQNTLFASFGKVSQGMPRYAKLRGDCPRSWRNSRKTSLGTRWCCPLPTWVGAVCMSKSGPGDPCFGSAYRQHCQAVKLSICVKSYAILIYLALLVISPYDPYVYRVKGCKYQ